MSLGPSHNSALVSPRIVAMFVRHTGSDREVFTAVSSLSPFLSCNCTYQDQIRSERVKKQTEPGKVSNDFSGAVSPVRNLLAPAEPPAQQLWYCWA